MGRREGGKEMTETEREREKKRERWGGGGGDEMTERETLIPHRS